MFYKMIMVLLTVISISFTEEPELGNWRWSEDTLQPTDDKQVHGVGSFGLYYLFTIVLNQLKIVIKLVKKNKHQKMRKTKINEYGLATPLF